MAFYDTPGLLYDSGVTYDSGSPPPTKGKRMQVKLSLNRLSPAEKVALANTVVTAMTGNPNFLTPSPPLATVTTQSTALNTKIGAYNSTKSANETALAERHDAEDTLDDTLASLAAYVENASGGDRTKIESAGMAVRAERTPPQVPGMVMNLSLTAGDFPGTLDAAWDPAPFSRMYDLQISPDPMSEASWVNKTTGTKSSKTIEGMTSGSKMWVRVRANGSAGPGPWSDPATKVVP
jgi:hypothetical protein